MVAVNEALAKSYIDALRHLRQLGGGEVKEKWCVTDLARLPDVLTVTKGEEDLETVSADLCEVLEEALNAYSASPGQLHDAVQIAVVHAADLHRNIPPVQGLSGSSIAGHALNQMDLLPPLI